ncbi:hypothetical protein AB0P37_24275 [Streptomyces antimycoticus]
MAICGDARRLHEMFALSVTATERCTGVVDHAGFTGATPSA